MIGRSQSPHRFAPPAASRSRRAQRGAVEIAEFALVLPFILMFIMGTLDLGLLTHARLIVSNISREVGSVASRTINLDATMTNLGIASAQPLDLAGANGRIYVTRIVAGTTSGAPNPTIKTQLQAGGLGAASKAAGATLGLTSTMYNHLKFNAGNGVADIPQVTVVEVYYKYVPITGFSGWLTSWFPGMPGLLTSDNGGIIISSRSVF